MAPGGHSAFVLTVASCAGSFSRGEDTAGACVFCSCGDLSISNSATRVVLQWVSWGIAENEGKWEDGSQSYRPGLVVGKFRAGPVTGQVQRCGSRRSSPIHSKAAGIVMQF